MADADLLAVSLSELDRASWNLDDYLKTRKDLSDSVTLGLLAANRIRQAPRPVPSDTFRSRARRSFVSLVQEQAVNRLTTSPPTFAQSIRRLLIGPILGPLAAIVLATLGAGVGLVSESALPESSRYPAKIGIERLEVLAAVTPTEQAQARLNLAASRLAEADVELKAGNAPVARILLGQVDAEIAGASAIVAAHGPENSGLNEIGRQIATLAATRDRVSARIERMRSVAGSSDRPGPNASDPAKLVGATSPSVEPESPPPVATSIVERANPVSPAATVVASASTIQSSKVGTDARAALIDRGDRLSRLLIVQVQSGDGDNAPVTARDFAEVTHALSAESNSDTAGKVPTSGRISIVVSATPGPGSLSKTPQSGNKPDSPNQKLPEPAKASISLPGALGIGVLLRPPPVAPPSTMNPEGARPLGLEAKRSLPAAWHAIRSKSSKPLRASDLHTKKPLVHQAGRPQIPKLLGKVEGAHIPPQHPAETSPGSAKVPPFTT